MIILQYKNAYSYFNLYDIVRIVLLKVLYLFFLLKNKYIHNSNIKN